jgi:hypothetical protein
MLIAVACDQCRKSKCKCERTAGDGESCKNCVMMNTRTSISLTLASKFPHSNSVACTFLGPSRKRGPPKGYIDAIEARLHQTEALLGIMIGSNDERARTLLEDLAKVNYFSKYCIPNIYLPISTGSSRQRNYQSC